MTKCSPTRWREAGARLFLRSAQGKMRQWSQIAPGEILTGHEEKIDKVRVVKGWSKLS